jgi:glutaredoxin 3
VAGPKRRPAPSVDAGGGCCSSVADIVKAVDVDVDLDSRGKSYRAGRRMSEITVYTAEPSEICARVKRLLDARGLSYTELDVQSDADRAALFEATGRKSCPVVVVGDEVVGGYRETVEADKSGRLAELAAG